MAFVLTTHLPHLLRPVSIQRDCKRPLTMSTNRTPLNKVLADVTKYTVSVAVGSLVLYNHDAPTIFYIMAAVLNSAAGKVLKLLIKQPRPDGAQRGDPGMPSSHATSLSFLSLAFLGYIALYFDSVAKTVGAGVMVIMSVLASSWRVSAGYHTVPQVVAGWIVGSINVAVYITLLPKILPRLDLLMEGKALFVTTVILMAAFVVIVGPDLIPFVRRFSRATRRYRDPSSQ
ncbi:unnamed protein product [Agarophyton chilense]